MSETLRFFRELDPSLGNVSDSELRGLIYRDHPKFLSVPSFRNEIRSQFGSDLNKATTSAESASDGLTGSIETLGRGLAKTAGDIGNFSKAIDTFRSSPIARTAFPAFIAGSALSEVSGLGNYLRGYNAVQDNIPAKSTVEYIKQAYREKGIADAAREAGAFASELALENVPQALATVLTSGGLSAAGVTPRVATTASQILSSAPQRIGDSYDYISRTSGNDGQAAALAAIGSGLVETASERAPSAPKSVNAYGSALRGVTANYDGIGSTPLRRWLADLIQSHDQPGSAVPPNAYQLFLNSRVR